MGVIMSICTELSRQQTFIHTSLQLRSHIIILTCIQYLRRIRPSHPPEESWALLCYHEPNFVHRSSKHRPTRQIKNP